MAAAGLSMHSRKELLRFVRIRLDRFLCHSFLMTCRRGCDRFRTVRVLGIDPGSETTGWGVVEGDSSGLKYRLVEFGALRLSASASFASRLLKISNGLAEIIDRLKPDTCAIEEAFYATNPKVTL